MGAGSAKITLEMHLAVLRPFARDQSTAIMAARTIASWWQTYRGARRAVGPFNTRWVSWNDAVVTDNLYLLSGAPLHGSLFYAGTHFWQQYLHN